MGDFQMFCTLPPSVLEHIGEILFIDISDENFAVADRGSSNGPNHRENLFNRAHPYITPLLHGNPTLFLVFVANKSSFDHIELARVQLQKNQRCRVIGGACFPDASSIASVCTSWIELFAPRLPFLLLNKSVIETMRQLTRNNARRARLARKEEFKKLLGFPDIPTTNRPLKSTELLALAIDAYAHGLPALTRILIKPLIDYWGLSLDSNSSHCGALLNFGRGTPEQFGELCRRLNIHIITRAVTCHSQATPQRSD